jgi:hypothetical protein
MVDRVDRVVVHVLQVQSAEARLVKGMTVEVAVQITVEVAAVQVVSEIMVEILSSDMAVLDLICQESFHPVMARVVGLAVAVVPDIIMVS